MAEEKRNPAAGCVGCLGILFVLFIIGSIVGTATSPSHVAGSPSQTPKQWSTAAETPRRSKERYYRDSKGAIASESEIENKLSETRSAISSMPDNLERAYLEGVLEAVEKEWARMKRQGPIGEW